MQGRVARLRPRATAAVLALAGYVVVFAVPFLKYPANPPGVGDPGTIGRRTTLYLTAIAVSILAAVVALHAGRAAARRCDPWYAGLAGVAVYAALATAAALALPAVQELPKGFPGETLWRFRLASLGTQACIWATLGVGFGALAERVLSPRARRVPSAAQS
jgi:hypothetical protein